MPKVAVENNLDSVKNMLQQNGYEVVNLEGESVPDCDCCVISGLDHNMMGMANTATDVSVINAEGLTDDEIMEQIRQRTQG